MRYPPPPKKKHPTFTNRPRPASCIVRFKVCLRVAFLAVSGSCLTYNGSVVQHGELRSWSRTVGGVFDAWTFGRQDHSTLGTDAHLRTVHEQVAGATWTWEKKRISMLLCTRRSKAFNGAYANMAAKYSWQCKSSPPPPPRDGISPFLTCVLFKGKWTPAPF